MPSTVGHGEYFQVIMLDVIRIQRRLADLPCPICGKQDYQVIPQRDSGPTAELFTARCKPCAYLFPLNVPKGEIIAHDPDTANQLSEMHCPSCTERGVQLDFRCSASVRDAYLFVTCRSCRHAFFEKAPMEAFE
jgi:hypothetical protein